MKVNPLKRSKISTLISTENVQRICTNHQITKTPKKQRNQRIKEHKTDTHCLRRDSCREPTSIGCHRLSKSIATRSLFLSFSNIFNLVLLYSLFFPRSTNTSTQMPQISNPSQIVKAFSHPKLNPVTKTTQIQPKTEEGKVEIKAQRERKGRPTVTSGGGGAQGFGHG